MRRLSRHDLGAAHASRLRLTAAILVPFAEPTAMHDERLHTRRIGDVIPAHLGALRPPGGMGDDWGKSLSRLPKNGVAIYLRIGGSAARLAVFGSNVGEGPRRAPYAERAQSRAISSRTALRTGGSSHAADPPGPSVRSPTASISYGAGGGTFELKAST
jgi:hypothetical protein